MIDAGMFTVDLPTFAVTTSSMYALNAAIDEVLPASDEPLCERCEASFRLEGDTLCAACRADVDASYADLPGASE